MGAADALHLTGQALRGLSNTPAAILRRFQYRQPHIACGGIHRIKDRRFLLAIAVPVTEQERGEEITTCRIFEVGTDPQRTVEGFLDRACGTGKPGCTQKVFHIAACGTAGEHQHSRQSHCGQAALCTAMRHTSSLLHFY